MRSHSRDSTTEFVRFSWLQVQLLLQRLWTNGTLLWLVWWRTTGSQLSTLRNSWTCWSNVKTRWVFIITEFILLCLLLCNRVFLSCPCIRLALTFSLLGISVVTLNPFIFLSDSNTYQDWSELQDAQPFPSSCILHTKRAWWSWYAVHGTRAHSSVRSQVTWSFYCCCCFSLSSNLNQAHQVLMKEACFKIRV